MTDRTRRLIEDRLTAGEMRTRAATGRTDGHRQRVELIRCSDPFTRLQPGERGTVVLVDSLGTVHVEWDSGSTLGLVPGEDSYRIIEE